MLDYESQVDYQQMCVQKPANREGSNKYRKISEEDKVQIMDVCVQKFAPKSGPQSPEQFYKDMDVIDDAGLDSEAGDNNQIRQSPSAGNGLLPAFDDEEGKHKLPISIHCFSRISRFHDIYRRTRR